MDCVFFLDPKRMVSYLTSMSLGFRRKSREVALQVLFQKSFHKNTQAENLFESFSKNFSFEEKTKDYAFYLIKSVIDYEEEINRIIEKKSDNWSLERIALIDKRLLQIGILELCFPPSEQKRKPDDFCSKQEDDLETEPLPPREQVPPKLVMTDIIDLAKKYSSEDSRKFINGILDAIYRDKNPTGR